MLQRGDFGPPFFFGPAQAVVVRPFTELFHNVTKCLFSCGPVATPGAEKDIPKLLKIFSKIQLFSFSPTHTASRLIILAYHFASPGMQGIKVVFPVLADSFFFQ